MSERSERAETDRQPSWRTLVAGAVARGVDATDARRIGEEASGAEGAAWALAVDEPCAPLTRHRFDEMVQRRLSGEPLQYVLGRWGFRELDLLVDQRALIPRPETEWVVEAALQLLVVRRDPVPVAIDLGTGSGAIALSVAAARAPRVRVVGTDVSPEALSLARANLAGLGGRGTVVELYEGDWYGALPGELRGEVDLVVSNPPYIAADEVLPGDVADWEPRAALIAGPTGLEAIALVVAGAATWLRPGGALVVEIGETQGSAATALASDAGLIAVEVRRDLSGRDRMLVGRSR